MYRLIPRLRDMPGTLTSSDLGRVLYVRTGWPPAGEPEWMFDEPYDATAPRYGVGCLRSRVVQLTQAGRQESEASTPDILSGYCLDPRPKQNAADETVILLLGMLDR